MPLGRIITAESGHSARNAGNGIGRFVIESGVNVVATARKAHGQQFSLGAGVLMGQHDIQVTNPGMVNLYRDIEIRQRFPDGRWSAYHKWWCYLG
ncbi:MAG: hypothetical protein M5U34_30760 [Chloroflexi bacterium]|nr:hypothetical protein [Chloroflexota bacterium]